MAPRWKGRRAEAKALADPMSKIVSELQSILIQSSSWGVLAGCSVLLGADSKQTDLFDRACFGVIMTNETKPCLELSLEEAFYLCFSLNCLKIVRESDHTQTNEELWKYMTSVRKRFPDTFKAYSHLRNKNWVVRSGSQYGVDFVAYHHHPSLVHSQYCVIVLSEGGDADANDRLRVWSDYQCQLRLCGSVAKTLLVIYVNRNGKGSTSSSCLGDYSVQEWTITGWSPEQCREEQAKLENKTK